MRLVSTTEIASQLNLTDNAALEQQVNAAVSELERLLGYPLCGTPTAEERIFKWTDTLWHRTHPMWAQPTSITLVRNNQEETITDFQLGQNGKLFGDWFNAFKLCNICQVGRCTHYLSCDYVKVVAKWGFAEPATVEESGDEDDTYQCYLPDDLFNVLLEAIKDGGNAKKDIQSENTGTRSYSKFAKSYESAWQKNSGVIEFYKLREPRL